MSPYTIRLGAFGSACSLLFGSIGLSLAYLVTDHGFPETLRWLGTIYMLAGLPLGCVLALALNDHVLEPLFGEDAEAAFALLFLASAFVTWTLIFSLLRHRWIRKREECT